MNQQYRQTPLPQSLKSLPGLSLVQREGQCASAGTMHGGKDQRKDQKDQKDQKGGKDQKDQKDQKDPAVHAPERIRKDPSNPPSGEQAHAGYLGHLFSCDFRIFAFGGDSAPSIEERHLRIGAHIATIVLIIAVQVARMTQTVAVRKSARTAVQLRISQPWKVAPPPGDL